MTPLRVSCNVPGEMILPDGYLHLDALLAWAACQRDGIPPALTPDDIVPIEIPIERAGPIHMASASVMDVEARATIHLVRRFPTQEAARMSTMTRVNLAAGAQKNYRIPIEAVYPRGGLVEFFAVGERVEVAELLALVTHLGKKRSVGHGRILGGWKVEECDTWSGFPVLGRDGSAIRHLPIGWPGLGAHHRRIGRLSYPYWSFADEQEIAAPLVA